ncbi:hypothetical protein SLS57_009667 [Botryosphaeria dothidea]
MKQMQEVGTSPGPADSSLDLNDAARSPEEHNAHESSEVPKSKPGGTLLGLAEKHLRNPSSERSSSEGNGTEPVRDAGANAPASREVVNDRAIRKSPPAADLRSRYLLQGLGAGDVGGPPTSSGSSLRLSSCVPKTAPEDEGKLVNGHTPTPSQAKGKSPASNVSVCRGRNGEQWVDDPSRDHIPVIRPAASRKASAEDTPRRDSSRPNRSPSPRCRTPDRVLASGHGADGGAAGPERPALRPQRVAPETRDVSQLALAGAADAGRAASGDACKMWELLVQKLRERGLEPSDMSAAQVGEWERRPLVGADEYFETSLRDVLKRKKGMLEKAGRGTHEGAVEVAAGPSGLREEDRFKVSTETTYPQLTGALDGSEEARESEDADDELSASVKDEVKLKRIEAGKKAKYAHNGKERQQETKEGVVSSSADQGDGGGGSTQNVRKRMNGDGNWQALRCLCWCDVGTLIRRCFKPHNTS